MSDKQHYHLVAGYVYSINPADKEPVATSTFLNAVVPTPDGRVSAAVLGEGQVALQVQMKQRASASGVEVGIVDVQFVSWTHLGEFTPQEFTGVDLSKVKATVQ